MSIFSFLIILVLLSPLSCKSQESQDDDDDVILEDSPCSAELEALSNCFAKYRGPDGSLVLPEDLVDVPCGIESAVHGVCIAEILDSEEGYPCSSEHLIAAKCQEEYLSSGGLLADSYVQCINESQAYVRCISDNNDDDSDDDLREFPCLLETSLDISKCYLEKCRDVECPDNGFEGPDDDEALQTSYENLSCHEINSINMGACDALIKCCPACAVESAKWFNCHSASIVSDIPQLASGSCELEMCTSESGGTGVHGSGISPLLSAVAGAFLLWWTN